MPVSTPKYKNLFCQTLKKQVLIRGFLLYSNTCLLRSSHFTAIKMSRVICTVQDYIFYAIHFKNKETAAKLELCL